MPLRGRRIALAILSATFLMGTVMARRAEAQTFTTLHNFSGSPNDGEKPAASLIRDSSGDLYSTTVYGSRRQRQHRALNETDSSCVGLQPNRRSGSIRRHIFTNGYHSRPMLGGSRADQ